MEVNKLCLDYWDDKIKRICLDGNNMLFVDQTVRKLCLSKKYNQA